MKQFQYMFNYSTDEYEKILKQVRFNHLKNEKEIFGLLVLGYSCQQIAEKMNLSYSTIKRRRKSIYEKVLRETGIDKINKKEKDSLFCVYILIFPNSKVYIGQTSNTDKRWRDGNGYKYNEKMYNDICKYGWDNVTKNVLYKDLTYNQSLEKEKELIIHYKSNLPLYGYNKDF